jgi:hypothetical protein
MVPVLLLKSEFGEHDAGKTILSQAKGPYAALSVFTFFFVIENKIQWQ